MEAMGQQDAIIRNYDLTNRTMYGYCKLARLRLGFDASGPLNWFIDGVRARLRNMGYRAGTNDQLEDLINRWYVWHTIRTGERRRRSYRPDLPSVAPERRLDRLPPAFTDRDNTIL